MPKSPYWLVTSAGAITSADGGHHGHVVVVNVGGVQVGLVVDFLVGQEEVVIKPLGALLQGLDGMAGATITGGGDGSTSSDLAGDTVPTITSMIEKGIGPGDIPVYGTDGNMGNALAEQFDDPSQIAGMKGTTPLTDLSSDFTDRLDEIDPNLEDYNYAGESYDAVIITALAANIAGTDEPSAVAAEINGVTKDGTTCTTYAECLELIEAGEDIDYDGITGPLSFGDAGEPSEASFGILVFGDDGIDSDQTTFEFATI